MKSRIYLQNSCERGEETREFIKKDNILFLIMRTGGQLNMILLQKLQ